MGFFSEMGRTLAASGASLVLLFALSKLMGNKQISQLTLFDYIIGITIGSIAAELATDLQDPVQPVTAMIVYAFAAYIVTMVSLKSVKARKFIVGRPLILMDNGKIYRKNLRKSHIDLSDFMMQCRTEGYFDLNQIQTAIIENNGKLSILPVSSERPATPSDLELTPQQEEIQKAVILDGHINHVNLKYTGNNETWLINQLKAQKYNSPKEVLLALCDNNNKLTLYPVETKNDRSDVFE